MPNELRDDALVIWCEDDMPKWRPPLNAEGKADLAKAQQLLTLLTALLHSATVTEIAYKVQKNQKIKLAQPGMVSGLHVVQPAGAKQ